ncbi:hypothetical protein UFOVP457_57 [uncultured Caudovirales phage]|uniref:Uncharacterized protein n=1 Tax=uncultured Caudovirales phage TaxID=2100421 RepID=A0A6J5MD76_9CAUD|nr:hypothetical protein UFOVP457_57 [uncultured Caudovirales phage]
MNNYEYYELDDYVDPNCPEQIYIKEAGRGMAIDDLQKELERLYAEHADLLKKQNLLYEKLAEVEKKQGETNEKRK